MVPVSTTFPSISGMNSFAYSRQFATFIERYQDKKESLKRKIHSQVESIVDEMFDYVLREVITNFANSRSGEATQSVSEVIEVIDLEAEPDFVTNEPSTSTLTSLEKQRFASKRKRSCLVPQSVKNHFLKRYKVEQRKKKGKSSDITTISNSSSDSDLSLPIDLGDDEPECLSESVSENEATMKNKIENLGDNEETDTQTNAQDLTTAAAVTTKPPNTESVIIDETFLRSEMELNKAMFCIFFDGEKYFLCDIEEHHSKKGVPFYKVYNVGNCRPYKTFNLILDFIQFLIKPAKFHGSLQSDQRALVAWKLGDDHLKPAIIHEVFGDHQKVEVHCDSGEKGIIHFDDVFILPGDIPLVASESPATSSSSLLAISSFYRSETIMDDIYNRYAEHKHNYNNNKKNQVELDGVWRWSEMLDKDSFYDSNDDTYVNAVIFKSVWKNNRVKFSIGDDVVIWDDYSEDSDESPSFPIIGRIKLLYENVPTKQKQVQFNWYVHPAEKENCQLKPLNGALFESTEWTTVDVDFLLGKVSVMPYSQFAISHPKYNYLVQSLRNYRDSLAVKPYRDYFKTGKYDHQKDIFIYDIDLLKRDEEFFLQDRDRKGKRVN